MVQPIYLLGYAAAASAQFNFAHSQYETSPPVYPSRNITGAGGWSEAREKAQAFVVQLSVEEKAGMVTGTPGPCVGNIAPISRLNFSGLCLQDGPLAIRQAVYASVFPAELSVAASWDRTLTRQRGLYMGREFRGKGAHVALGPVIGPLGRSPFGGRNWEGFSPDAYLSGELVAESVIGIQNARVQATTKHYILNEQETQRNPSTNANGTVIDAVSSNVDDKTMHETYLWPFANAVRAGTASIMCSYNRLNGSYGCQNSKTLNGLLKDELGFQGYVMSDWLATHSGVPSIEAGLVNMPGGIEFLKGSPSYFGDNVTVAVNNGSLSLSRLDDMVLRIMTPYYYLNQDLEYPPVDGFTPKIGFFPPSNYVHNFTLGSVVDVRRPEHTKLIRDLGAAGTVLLKNVDASLPLKQPMKIGVFGNDGADYTVGEYSLALSNGGLANGDYDIGTLAVGGGSGTGRFTYVVSPLEAIKSRAQSYGALVQYITDNNAIAGGALASLAPFPLDVCLVFLKSWASEGFDRTTLIAEWNSSVVVESVAAQCANTVVVLHGASPNVLPWTDNPNVTAILAAHMPGQESGHSLADILWGDVDPSGRLPYTVARNDTDYAKNLINSTELLETTDPNAWQADFVEGNFIDYKAFHAKNESVAYEFGFGLSYATFNVSGLKITLVVTNASRTPNPNAPIQPGGNVELWATLATVSVSLSNIGTVSGSAVPQLYLSFPAEANAPVKNLRGFEKVALSAGTSGMVQFPLSRRDLSYWDVVSQAWTLPVGLITVRVGFSSRDLPLQGTLTVYECCETGTHDSAMKTTSRLL
ncbi:glycoside hydrolase family 3 protein [Plenodomus tracheiphilus IPT5]|uniref:Probable beta-glucosidase G n=1 Tax=Plenodomus tracheiphilus IPT5 TaxID=1408161 RepID=A0A6A7AS46_9PLEO|nr:glycoside hydrolase family 3 protein [Plenodomus tracheiphilus IPT5]